MAAAKPYDVLVSYRRADASVAQALTQLLRTFGQRVFLDLDSIALGTSWDDAIRRAASEVSTLLVLWSRSAASSTYMQDELRFVSGTCHVIPVLLDGSPLPPDLAQRQALVGLQVHERLIARVTELVRSERKSQTEAVEQVVDELKQDGIELTREQRKALGLFVRALGGVGVIASLLAQLRGGMRRTTHAIISKQGIAVTLGIGIAFFGGRLATASETTTDAITACPDASQTQGPETDEQADAPKASPELAAARRREKTLRGQLNKRDAEIKELTKARDLAYVQLADTRMQLGEKNVALVERDKEIVILRQNQCKPPPVLH